jgi:KaiC/GvpD/RAD55 family RecA-like ATPase
VTAVNRAWGLEDFLDSLIIELDKAQDTLAVKGVTRPLTYTVKDVALDLHTFPIYDGRQVRFTTAQPGEAGASRLTIERGAVVGEVAGCTRGFCS